MEYLLIILRTLLLYGFITFVFRLMGKREIGELSILDLVVFIMIGELAVVAIQETKESLIKQLIPVVMLLGLQLFFAFLSLKNEKFRRLVDGRPSIIINRGKIDEKTMKKLRYNFDDLLLQLREQNIANIANVEYAILEPSGSLSVFEKSQDDTSTEISLPLVMDGIIQKENLNRIEQTEDWLMKNLQDRGYQDTKLISFCSYTNGEFFIDEKDSPK